SLAAQGYAWETRTVPHPRSQNSDKSAHSFYLECCGSNDCNNRAVVCPEGSEGFEVDDSPIPGFSGGMSDVDHVRKGSSGYGVVLQQGACLQLYCDGRSGPSNVWIGEVYVRQHRRRQVPECAGPQKQEAVMRLGDDISLPLDVGVAA